MFWMVRRLGRTTESTREFIFRLVAVVQGSASSRSACSGQGQCLTTLGIGQAVVTQLSTSQQAMRELVQTVPDRA